MSIDAPTTAALNINESVTCLFSVQGNMLKLLFGKNANSLWQCYQKHVHVCCKWVISSFSFWVVSLWALSTNTRLCKVQWRSKRERLRNTWRQQQTLDFGFWVSVFFFCFFLFSKSQLLTKWCCFFFPPGDYYYCYYVEMSYENPPPYAGPSAPVPGYPPANAPGYPPQGFPPQGYPPQQGPYPNYPAAPPGPYPVQPGYQGYPVPPQPGYGGPVYGEAPKNTGEALLVSH